MCTDLSLAAHKLHATIMDAHPGSKKRACIPNPVASKPREIDVPIDQYMSSNRATKRPQRIDPSSTDAYTIQSANRRKPTRRGNGRTTSSQPSALETFAVPSHTAWESDTKALMSNSPDSGVTFAFNNGSHSAAVAKIARLTTTPVRSSARTRRCTDNPDAHTPARTA